MPLFAPVADLTFAGLTPENIRAARIALAKAIQCFRESAGDDLSHACCRG